MTPYQRRIGIGQWIVAVKLDSEASRQAISHYELGSREIGDVTRDPLGLLIPIRWYYERPRGSDIWYERTHQVLMPEYEAVCVPVIPTYLPQKTNRKDRIILWTTTQIEGCEA